MTDMNEKTYHFISGLPRSGSTLLSSILKQNPRFTAGITDPLQAYTDAIIRSTENVEGGRKLVEAEKRQRIIRGIFDSYYEDGPEVCFNTGRTWTAKTSLLKVLYPDFKMIVCVRSIPWILNSFEKLHTKDPLATKPVYGNQIIHSIDDRCMSLFNIENCSGVVGDPLKMMRTGVYSKEADHMIFVEYNALTKYPEQTMRKVYEFLGEDYFDHDFNDVEDSYEEYDLDLKMSGLHNVRKKVEYIEGKRLLPPQVWNKYIDYNFWEDRHFDRSQLNWIGEPKG
jgi:sulfotransferase